MWLFVSQFWLLFPPNSKFTSYNSDLFLSLNSEFISCYSVVVFSQWIKKNTKDNRSILSHFFSCNCKVISHNSNFSSQNCIYHAILTKSHISGKKDRTVRYKLRNAIKKSELWDKKLQLPFYVFIFYPMVETRFHNMLLREINIKMCEFSCHGTKCKHLQDYYSTFPHPKSQIISHTMIFRWMTKLRRAQPF